jgi:hypothetical protein
MTAVVAAVPDPPVFPVLFLRAGPVQSLSGPRDPRGGELVRGHRGGERRLAPCRVLGGPAACGAAALLVLPVTGIRVDLTGQGIDVPVQPRRVPDRGVHALLMPTDRVAQLPAPARTKP